MPAPIRDVRVVSPAVSLPGPLARRPPSSGPLRSAGRGFAALRGLPCELKRSPSPHGLQAICGTASAAVIGGTASAAVIERQ